jgi:serine/threonine protein phosphatase PrpC
MGCFSIFSAALNLGHGGKKVSEWLSQNFVFWFLQYMNMAAAPSSSTSPIDMPQFLRGFFLATDQSIQKQLPEASYTCGSTLSLAVLYKNVLYLAHVGDSRIILIETNRKTGKKRLLHETIDHNVDHLMHLPSEERRRLQAMVRNRSITMKDSYLNIVGEREQIMLTRSMGDFSFKQARAPALTASPDIFSLPIPERGRSCDYTVILASDGVWDAMSSRECMGWSNSISTIESKAKGSADNQTCLVVRI